MPSYEVSLPERARRFVAVYVVLGVIAVASLVAFYAMATDDVRTVTRTAPAAAPASTEALAGMLGDPAQRVAGADVNPQLEGAQCGVYQFEDGIVLVCR